MTTHEASIIIGNMPVYGDECYTIAEYQEAKGMAIKALSAERKGHWIKCKNYNGDIYYKCSECKEDFCLIDGTPTDNLYFYCPYCGSHNPTIRRMEGEKE